MERAIPDGFTKIGETAKVAGVHADEFVKSFDNMSYPLVHKVNLTKKKKRRAKNKAAKQARKRNR